jgi:hypothetical protein
LEVHEKKRGELPSERGIGNIEENIAQGLNPSVATITTIWCGIRRFSAAARAMMCSTEEELKAKWAEKKKGPTAPPPVPEPTMKAVVIRAPGGPEVLELRVVEEAKVGEGEVLIKVVAAALNKADCKQRKGNNPPPHGRSLYPGLECSGIIDAVGSGVSDWKVGDEVRCFVNNGNFSCLSLNFFFIIHRLLMLQSPQVRKNIMQSTNPTCASSLSLHLFLKQNIRSAFCF